MVPTVGLGVNHICLLPLRASWILCALAHPSLLSLAVTPLTFPPRSPVSVVWCAVTTHLIFAALTKVLQQKCYNPANFHSSHSETLTE